MSILFCVLTFFTAQLKSETVVSNLGAADNGFMQVANDIWLGVEFTTDNHSFLLDSITLRAEAYQNKGTFSVNIFSSAGSGIPGSLVSGGHLQGINPVSNGLYTFSATSTLELAPLTSYYLVVGVDPFGGYNPDYGQFMWRLGTQPASGNWAVSPNVLWDHPDYGWFVTYQNLTPVLAINATVVPEPSIGCLLVIAGIILAVFGRRTNWVPLR